MKVSGALDPKGLPVIVLRVRGPYGSRELEAYVDTCFGGNLSIPRGLMFSLGLRSVGKMSLVSATGEVTTASTVECQIEWEGQWRDGEISVGSANSVPLVGARLMYGRKLTIDYGAARSVEIE